MLIGIGLFVAVTQMTAAQGQLEVRQMEVNPRLVRSGDIVQIHAIIANVGDVAISDLRIGPSVANAWVPGQYGPHRRRWTPLNQVPAEPIPSLASGDEVEFSATLRLDGDGSVKVGLGAGGRDTTLLPIGTTVRIVSPAASLQNASLLFPVFLAGFALIGWLALAAFRPRDDYPVACPSGFTLGLGISLLLLSSAVALNREDWYQKQVAVTCIASFAFGWILTGAGIRPRGRRAPGIALASTAYIVLGLVWTIVVNVGVGSVEPELLLTRSSLFAMFAWPFELAQFVGLLEVTMTPI